MKTIVVFFENDSCGIWWSVELYWETLRNKQQTGTYSSENETFSKFYYLSTGMSYSNLQHTIRIHRTTIGQFIPEINETIFLRLKDKYLKVRHSLYCCVKQIFRGIGETWWPWCCATCKGIGKSPNCAYKRRSWILCFMNSFVHLPGINVKVSAILWHKASSASGFFASTVIVDQA